jgi:group I intron endonuclease
MNMRICGIYVITNLKNGMKYVGRSVNCNQRWILHKYEARSKRRKFQALHQAISDYGVENFKFEVLKELPEELLADSEREAMNSLNTKWPYGYNVGSEYGGSSEGSYKREANLRNQREKDPEFDKRYRAARSKAAKARIQKEFANPEWQKECRERASKTFRERMKNEEYRNMISNQRRLAAKASYAAKLAKKQGEINVSVS